jgi:hypothetical protein
MAAGVQALATATLIGGIVGWLAAKQAVWYLAL